jgi:hypothetical protein
VIGLIELLTARGLPKNAKAKMVRHEDPVHSVEDLRRDGQLVFYQGYQTRPIFECDYVIAFLGQPNRRALFDGVFRVHGRSTSDGTIPPGLAFPEWAAQGRLWYDLEHIAAFDDLRDRVVIDWGDSTRSWHQWLRDREVVEVLPRGYVKEFPGYLEFILTFDELRRIVGEPVANREWHRMLRAIAGVYLIVDGRTGKQYVGSAYGEGGILQRWSEYAQSGHGGNKLLREITISDDAAVGQFTFTILQTLPRTTTAAEVIAYEQLHKQKLGSRAHGLNSN